MVRQITPEEAGREIAWEQFHLSPMPFASLVASIDAGNLMDFYNRHRGTYHLNTVILYLLLKACEPVKEAKLNLIDGKIYQFDTLCVSYTLYDDDGKLRICCIPYNDDLDEFQAEYNRLTLKCKRERRDIFFSGMMQIGTSNLGAYNVNVEAAIPGYCPKYNNPFFVFGKIIEQDKRKVLRITLNVNHILMDGAHICAVLENFQNLINGLK